MVPGEEMEPKQPDWEKIKNFVNIRYVYKQYLIYIELKINIVQLFKRVKLVIGIFILQLQFY